MILDCPACRSRYNVQDRAPGHRVRCRCGEIFAVPRVSQSAGTLKCPRCGGPASPDDTRCSHCSAALAAVTCPRCFGRVFKASAHCVHCGCELGGKPSPVEAAAQVNRPCPRCPPSSDAQLEAQVVAETLLDECRRCGGVWVDSGALSSLIKNKERQALLLEKGGANLRLDDPGVLAVALAEQSRQLRYLPCPECAQLMNRRNFGQRSGVVIDVCKQHGTWFDRDELGRVVQYVMGGGLEEARRQELELLDRRLAERKAALSGPRPEGLTTLGPSKVDSLLSDVFSVISGLFWED